jgi:hypothetical protein
VGGQGESPHANSDTTYEGRPTIKIFSFDFHSDACFLRWLERHPSSLSRPLFPSATTFEQLLVRP